MFISASCLNNNVAAFAGNHCQMPINKSLLIAIYLASNTFVRQPLSLFPQHNFYKSYTYKALNDYCLPSQGRQNLIFK